MLVSSHTNFRKLKIINSKTLQLLSNRKTYFLFALLITLLISIIYSLESKYNIDYNPINGTFQNYNPIRRLYLGQIPIKDFSDYLGLGHLFLGYIITIVFGGKYADSIFAFSFITILAFALISYIIGKTILKDSLISLIITNLLLICIMNIEVTNGIFKPIFDAFSVFTKPGNSARAIRALAPVLAIVFIQCILKIIKFDDEHKHANNNIIIISGIIFGMFFLWSNDYGISSWVSSCVMIIIIFLSKKINIIRIVYKLCLYIISSATSVVILITAISKGNIKEWINQTFGTGGYQSWYYLSPKSFYLFDIDLSFLVLLQLLFCIYCIYKLFVCFGSLDCINRYGVLCYLNLTCICAVNEYKLLSGGTSNEVAISILFLTIIFEFINLLYIYLKGVKPINLLFVVYFSFAVSCCWIISESKDIILAFHFDDRGHYQEELGGYLDKRYNDLTQALNFIGEEKVFSTYASALEVASNVSA